MKTDDLAEVFAEALVRIGERDERVVVLDTDLPDSCSTEAFGRRFPDRVWDIRIAEQSLPTFAAGLALSDTRMILSGAIPAALLALGVDGMLGAFERAIRAA